MVDYIDREAAIEQVRQQRRQITTWDDFTEGLNEGVEMALGAIKSVPAADVAPVVHGRWESVIDDDEFWGEMEYYKCSACGVVELTRSNYCPYCAAKMDGDT